MSDDKQRARQRAYYQRNRERLLARRKVYRLSRLDAFRVAERKYAQSPRGKARRKVYHIERTYKISDEQWATMRAAQDNKCAICEQELERLCVDHNHATGELRGLLCVSCNAGIGCFKESLQLLERAKEYLKSHEEDKRQCA